MKLILVLLLAFSSVDCAKILAFFYTPSISHQYIFREIVKELSLRGHEVTFVSPDPMKNIELKNLTEIDVSVAYQTFKKFDFSNSAREKVGLFEGVSVMQEFTKDVVKAEMNNEGVKEILRKPEDAYDLILIEIHCPIFFGLQHKFKAPMIAISSLNVYSHFHHLFGNPLHPVLYPDIFSELVGPLTSIREKFDSLLVNIVWWILSECYTFPEDDALARSYFGEDMPYIRDMIKKTSLLMLNINPIFSSRRPNVPNVIEFFNVHLRRTDELPKDIQKYLDDAKNGAVYFSLGTNVRFDHLEGNVKETILEALGELPYTVLCKWESEDFPGKPNNVVLRKWFLQQAILAHPNVKVFVTQGGLQSSEEAISNGVPLVVIPFLVDQPLNAKILTGQGVAETILPRTLNKDILRDTILKVTNNERYRLKAQEARSIFLDQPQSGLDKVIWWCEYVIRHKGARHLRSPGADIPLYEYFMLDVLAVIIAALFVTYKVLRILIKTFLGLLKSDKKSISQSKQKKQ